jgi:hypothetical protein
VTTTEAGEAPKALGDRLLAVWPLLFSFLVIASLYVWQASKHPTPWLFSDEIEYAQISRAIADTGRPARRGVEYWGAGLFPWVIAPFWWIDSLQTAYGAVKTFNSLVMTAAMFPTYALARMLMPRPYALLAAIGSVLAPFFIYSAMVMQEPVAYFTAALSFYVAARVLATPTRWSIAAAVALAVVAPFVRDELIVVPAIMVAALGIQYICFGGGRTYLANASNGRRVALAVGAVVAALLCLVVARAGASQVEIAFARPGTMLRQARWAWGATIVGLGVLPAVIGIAMVVPAPGIRRTRGLAAFTSVLGASLLILTLYVAVKGTYQAATFEERIEERNLLYIAPLLTIALAHFAATRQIRVWALALAAALTAWAIASLPLNLAGLEGDAPGLAILSRWHDDYELGVTSAHKILYGLIALSVLVGLTPLLLRRRQIATWIVVGAFVLSIGWSTWAETAAATYSNNFSDLFYNGLPKPLGWVDEATGGKPAVYIGQKIADPNGIWSMEFWNRSVRRVWSLDGTAPGPGPVLTPDLIATDGRLDGDPGYEYAVTDAGLAIAGTPVVTQGATKVVRIAKPLRLRNSLAGVFTDGWIGSKIPADRVMADYNQFDAPSKPGVVSVTLSRKGFCGPPAPGHVLIEVGTIALGQQKNGILGRTTQARGWTIDSCAERTFPIETPGGPFHVRVTVKPPFQPSAVDPKNFEQRYFGAQLGIAFQPPVG